MLNHLEYLTMSIKTYFEGTIYLCVLFLLGFSSRIQAQEKNQLVPKWTKKELLFEDYGTKDWTEKWFLDGERAKVENLPMGMYYAAGSEAKNDTCHAVLWTKKSFQGNLLIEFDYTRVDTAKKFVNIIYFFATGEGTDEYPKDITLWSDKRKVPTMSKYFRNMNTYHISFAAIRNNGKGDYIRLRRYNPNGLRLKGSDILPDNFDTGLFKPFHNYHIQVVRLNNYIAMFVQNKNDLEDAKLCEWDVSQVPSCDEGRVGLRHMYTRSAIYKDFKIWRIE